MSSKTIVFETELEGYVNIGKPGGQYNTCRMNFCLPDEIHARLDKERAEMLERVVFPKGKTPQGINKPVWDETGLIGYSFDKQDDVKPPYRPPFIDAVGDQVPLDVLASARSGTRVVIGLEHYPYTKGKGGTTIQVTAVQITKLVTKDTQDSGPMSVADAAELLGKREGFTVGEPAVEAKATRADAEGYDF